MDICVALAFSWFFNMYEVWMSTSGPSGKAREVKIVSKPK